MVQFKSIILITIIGLAILLSGCVGNQAGTPTPTPIVTPTVTPTPTYTVTVTANPTTTATPIVMVTTPTPIATAPMLNGALYVDARMKKPSNWGNGTYELTSLQATITDVINIPISIRAQIVSDGEILEENSFTLQSGSSYNFANARSHIINSTNVSLWLLAEGYQPTEYKITKIYY
jgi:hypothetical protein